MDDGVYSVAAGGSRTLLCVGSDDELALLRPVLEHSCWDLRPSENAGLEHASERSQPCNAAVAFIHSASPSHLEELRRVLLGSNQLAWLALLRRPLLEHAAVRDFVVRHCCDYHSLPIDRDRLLCALGHAAGMAVLHGQPGPGPAKNRLPTMLGQSAAMRRLRREIEQAAASDDSVLICGESGTGKTLVAASLHGQSRRAQGSFEVLGCAALGASELRAALSGGDGCGTSGVGLGRGGTLLLDGVGDLPLESQAVLLRFLDRRESSGCSGTDARILCTTRVNLERALRGGQFRDDLYHRLNVLSIQVPPLRERPGDVEILAQAALDLAAPAAGVRRFSADAIAAMRRFDWPGNVRELFNHVRRAVAMTEEIEISRADLALQTRAEAEPFVPVVAGRRLAEHRLLVEALDKRGWQVREAARDLGVSRATFYRMLQRHGLSTGKSGGPGRTRPGHGIPG